MSGGLFTGDIGNLGEEAMGLSAVATPNAAVRGAAMSEGWEGGVAAAVGRFVERRAPQMEAPGAPGSFDNVDADPISAADANKLFGIEGVLKFDRDTSESVAAALNLEARAKLRRADVLARATGSFGSGTVAQIGMGFLGGALDPVGLAVGIVPVFGEAAMATRLGLAGSAGARAALRFGAGFVEGAAATVPLEALQYALTPAEMNDFSMSHALANVTFGGLLVGGLHAGGGALADRLLGRFRPEDRVEGLRGAVAAVAGGEPVAVAEALDAAAAVRASRDLYAFARRSAEIVDREIPEAGTGPLDRAASITTAAAELRRLKAERDALTAEARSARYAVLVDAARQDPVVAARLDAIDAELGGAIPGRRRADLEAEKQMLVEGAHPQGAAPTLESARSEAQATGLEAAGDRTAARIAETETRLARLRAEDAEMTAGETAGRRHAEASVRRDAIANASRREVLRAVSERAVRRYAAAWGAELKPGEAAAIVRDILGSTDAEIDDVLRAALADIRERGGAPGGATRLAAAGEADVEGAASAGGRAMDAEAAAAVGRLRDRLERPAEAPDVAAGRAAAASAEARAPKVEGEASKDAAAAEAEVAELDKALRSAVERGQMTEAQHAAVTEDLAELAAATRDDVSLFSAAASCILENG